LPQLDAEQKRIVRLIKAEGRTIRNRKLRRIFNRAAVSTGLVESNLHNLNYGDADSLGWRQERASLYKNPTNLRASIRRFREEFLQQYDPGETAGEVAAQVQRPAEQFRGRYADRMGEAKQILRSVAGGPGQSNRAGLPSRSPGTYTIPGVDNSGLRQQALQQYVTERGRPGALLDLKTSLDAAQDVPSRRVRVPRNGTVPQNTEHGNSRNDGLIGGLKELFWQGDGGINVKDGKRVQQGFVEGHADHVHVAGRQHDMIRLGKLAEQMGLRVGENPAFDPVDPVHTEGSYHYGRRVGKKRFRAIDVSGDPALMRKFAHRVASMYGVS